MFYGEASSGNGTQLVFSVTTQGSTSTLASFQANIESMLVSGSNGRYYSSVQPRGQLVTPFSVTSALGSQQVYSAQTFASSFSQNLPDGSLLGGAGWNGIDYVITCSLDGAVTPAYQFPPNQVLLSPVIYGNDGNYYGVEADTSNPAGYAARCSARLPIVL